MSAQAHRVVLTGAGFTKGFGGYLAKEINNRVISKLHTASVSNDLVTELLFPSGEKNYEDILGDLEFDENRQEDHRHFLEVILDIFRDMDISMCREIKRQKGSGSFQWQNVIFALNLWLNRTENLCIFTLNQDLFFERCWHPVGGSLRTPGVQNWQPRGVNWFDSGPAVVCTDQACNKSTSNSLNLYKLHGSFNWKHGGESLFVSGRAKESAIRSSPFLTLYFDIFEAELQSDNAEVLVIGYGFTDLHVNKLLLDCLEKGGTIWILDPCANDLRKRLIFPEQKDSQATSIDNQKFDLLSRVKTSNSPLTEVLQNKPHRDRPWAGEFEFLNS